ncbi:MAG: type II toxin-antitoxin system HicB family antitoxin [Pyrinomonadaceae bacterium]|nr:type II toxin-antitoxin system HicB family antitoxin [Pyrinomonadaceae bacterium]
MNKKTDKKANKENTPKVEQYLYSVGWSEEDAAFVSRVAEFPSLAAHGDTLESALHEIKNVVGLVLQDLAETGEFIPQPFGRRSFSGRLVLRMPEYLHRKLALESMEQGVSLNQLLNLKLESKS